MIKISASLEYKTWYQIDAKTFTQCYLIIIIININENDRSKIIFAKSNSIIVIKTRGYIHSS